MLYLDVTAGDQTLLVHAHEFVLRRQTFADCEQTFHFIGCETHELMLPSMRIAFNPGLSSSLEHFTYAGFPLSDPGYALVLRASRNH
jgi:hypothetical protein